MVIWYTFGMKFLVTFFILFVLAPGQLFGITVDFTRTLKVGMSGEDVKALQVAMNRDPETRIAESGAGSPGNETSYFGLATKRAVIKFQEKHRVEVLVPAGLFYGSGLFGKNTRIKVLAIYQNSSLANTIQTTNPLAGVPTIQTDSKLSPRSFLDTILPKNPNSFLLIDKKDFNVTTSGRATNGEYYDSYAKLSTEVVFSQEELGMMKKKTEKSNETGGITDRVLSLEELIDLRKNGDTSREVLVSFVAWASLDRKMVDGLKKMAVTSAVLDTNQKMASWFAYHALTAERFGSETLTTAQANNFEQEYKTNAKTHTGTFRKSIAKAWGKEPFAFSVINRAEASLCGLTQFGGRVASYLTCNLGTVHTIVGTCGGLVLYTWAAVAANPYNWHNIYTITIPTLGRSVINPTNVCPVGCGFPPCGYVIPATDIALYYGTALII